MTAQSRVFEDDFGRLAVAICHDVEFPEVARAAARHNAFLLIVPSCTDDRRAFLRVRCCAHTRTTANQMHVPAVSLSYGQASILTPSDFSFARNGILAEGTPNHEAMVIGELNLATIEKARASGTVLPLKDSVTTAERVARTEVVRL